MGTTIVAIQVRGRWAAVAHVGDSRAYQYRAGRLGQLTEDHSAFAECVRAGVVDPNHPERFPRRNIITRAVGPRPMVEVDTQIVDVARGDVFLLCSDGLSGPLRHAELEAILRLHPDPDDAAASLVRRGNEAGGPDNITAVTVKCV
jgi:protein phosphatase